GQREQQCEGMCGYLVGAVVRHVTQGDPQSLTGLYIDVVDPHPVTDDSFKMSNLVKLRGAQAEEGADEKDINVLQRLGEFAEAAPWVADNVDRLCRGDVPLYRHIRKAVANGRDAPTTMIGLHH